jgi:hypothetical protein
VVLHRGRIAAAGNVTTVIENANSSDMRSAFIALTGGGREDP